MINLTEAKQKELINLAYDMRKNSYCPYSGFAVGAALLAEDGRIYTGCNMENASFGAGICAERSAFAKANADGNRRFKAIAVAGGKAGLPADNPCVPCGICLQVMQEFCDGDFIILLSDRKQENIIRKYLRELLPFGFGKSFLLKND